MPHDSEFSVICLKGWLQLILVAWLRPIGVSFDLYFFWLGVGITGVVWSCIFHCPEFTGGHDAMKSSYGAGGGGRWRDMVADMLLLFLVFSRKATPAFLTRFAHDIWSMTDMRIEWFVPWYLIFWSCNIVRDEDGVEDADAIWESILVLYNMK
jgi:hypothetical protein